MPPGLPSSPSLPPGPPSSPSSPCSPSLTNVTPLSAPGPSEKTRTVRSRTKLLQSDSQKFFDQLKLEALQRPRPKSPRVIPIMPTHETHSDGAIKKIKGQSKKYGIKKQKQNKRQI